MGKQEIREDALFVSINILEDEISDLKASKEKLLDENVRLRELLKQYAFWIKTEYKLATEVLDKVEAELNKCPFFSNPTEDVGICHNYGKQRCNCKGTMGICDFPEL